MAVPIATAAGALAAAAYADGKWHIRKDLAQRRRFKDIEKRIMDTGGYSMKPLISRSRCN